MNAKTSESSVSVSATAIVCALILIGLFIWPAAEACPPPTTYTLTVVVDHGGTTSPSGSPSPGTAHSGYSSGEVERVTATPSTDWRFDHFEDWSGTTIGTPGQNYIDITMNGNKFVEAVFERTAVTLTVRNEGEGTTDPSEGEHDCGYNEDVTITADPASGWEFGHWEDGYGQTIGTSQPSITITMDSDKTVTAVFDGMTLTVIVDGEGDVVETAGQTSVVGTKDYALNTVLELQAQPASGWVFAHWEGGLSGDTNPDSVTMDADKTVTAVFGGQPTADFQGSPTAGVAPLHVQFTSTSDLEGAANASYVWDLDGDGETDSTDENPQFTYDEGGLYTVTLSVTTEYGSDSETKTDYIEVKVAPSAAFSASPTTGVAPLGVTFQDESTAGTAEITSWVWDLGDGTTVTNSTDADVSHVYQEPGLYTVSLTVTTTVGSDTEEKTDYITVFAPPVPDFIGDPTSGVAPLEVTFSDETSPGDEPILLWTWNFGDGTPGAANATGEDVAHTYTAPGAYTVSLTVATQYTSVTATKTEYIHVQETEYPANDPEDNDDGDNVDQAETEQEPEEGDPFYVKDADPVNLFSGEYTAYVEDLRVAGRGLDLVWARTYRSRITTSTGLGGGWDHSYNAYIKELDNDAAGKLQVLLHRGGRHRRDVFKAPQGTTQYTRNGFFGYIDRDTSDDSFTLTLGDRTVWHFGPLNAQTGLSMLTSIVDRNGNTISLQYDVDNRLTGVVDTLGRTLTIHYRDGRIDYVQFANDTSRRVVYSYYAGLSSGGPAGTLKDVRSPTFSGVAGHDFPNGKMLTYTYRKQNPGVPNDEAIDGNLLTVTDGEGQTFLVNTYGEDPSSAGTFDKVIEQQWGNPGETVQFSYPDDPPPPDLPAAVKTAIITNRIGICSTYRFAASNCVLRHSRSTGTGAVQERQADYNDNGKPTTITKAVHGQPAVASRYVSYGNGSVFDSGNIATVTRANLVTSETTTETYQYASGFRSRPIAFSHAESIEDPGVDPQDQRVADDFVTKHVDGEGHVTEHTYDANGNRLSTIYRESEGGPVLAQHNFTYTAGGQLETHTFPANGENGAGCRRVDKFIYENQDTNCPGDGYLSAMIVDFGGLNLTTTFTTNEVGAVTSATLPGSNTAFFGVDTLNAVYNTTVSVTDVDGVPQQYQWETYYDRNDRVYRSEADDLSTPDLDYAVDYTRDILGAVTSRTEYLGGEPVVTSFGYDANRNLRLVTTPEGNCTQWFRNDRGFVSEVHEGCSGGEECTGAGERVTRFIYDDQGNLVAAETGEGTASGTLVNARTCTGNFDGFQRLVRGVDPEGYATHYEYDGTGSVIEERLTNLAGTVIFGRTANTRDGMNRIATTATEVRDLATGALITSGGDGLRVTQYDYNGLSQPVRITDDNGHAVTLTYDGMNRLVQSADALGNTLSYAYALLAHGYRVTKTESLYPGSYDIVTESDYDELGRMLKVTENHLPSDLTTKFYYDFRGNIVKSVDAKGVETDYTYDALGRLVEVTKGGITTSRAYDLDSRLVAQTDGMGKQTTYAYDDLGNVSAVVHPDGATYEYVYNIHGDVIEMTDPNGTVTEYAYDGLGRMTSRDVTSVTAGHIQVPTWPEPFAYDAMGNVIRAENGHAIVTRKYDSTGNLLEEGHDFGPETAPDLPAAVATYDDLGNRLTLTYPSGRVLNYAYDGVDRLSAISDAVSVIAFYQYAGATRVKSVTHALATGSEVVRAYGHDDRGRTIMATHDLWGEDPPGVWSSEPIDHRFSQYDEVHNRTGRKDIRPGGPERDVYYWYDDLSRMSAARLLEPGEDEIRWDYTLNGAGSRTNVQKRVYSDPIEEVDFPYLPDADMHAYQEVPSAYDQYRLFDASGNLLQTMGLGANPAIRDLKYNHLNQMSQMRKSDLLETYETIDTYWYDALGRRVFKASEMGAEWYVYFGDRVLEEYTLSGVASQQSACYVYGQYVDDVLQMKRDTNADGSLDATYYYHADEQYNVFALTDETGAVVERYDYGDFGAPEFYAPDGTPRTESAVGNPYLFTGRRYDPESGFYYFRARYYEPRAGQFTTLDPIGVWGDPLNMGNGYAYCGNNPWSLVDPYGLEGGFLEGFAEFLGLAGLRDMRTRREQMVDGISMGHYIPSDNSALLLAGMADFGGKLCLQVRVEQVEEFSRSVANSVGYLLTAGSAFEWGQSYLDQAEEFKYSDPWVYYGTYGAHYTSMAASLSATGLMAYEYIAATPGGIRGIVPGLGGGHRGNALRGSGRPALADTGIVDDLFGARGKMPERPTYLYQKVSAEGEHMKFGITKNPATRYTDEQLNGGRLRILARGRRTDMRALERSLHETLPLGPEERQFFYITKQVLLGLKPPPYGDW